MTDQSISTTTPGPAVPQDRVLLPLFTPHAEGTILSPSPGQLCWGSAQLNPTQDLKVLPTHWRLRGGCSPVWHFGGTPNSCKYSSSICGT